MTDTRNNPYPAIASMVLPQVAELVRQHVTPTSLLVPASEAPLLPVSSSLAASASASVVCSDPTEVGEEVTA